MVEKKSLISNRATVKKAILATRPIAPAPGPQFVASPNKLVGSPNKLTGGPNKVF